MGAAPSEDPQQVEEPAKAPVAQPKGAEEGVGVGVRVPVGVGVGVDVAAKEAPAAGEALGVGVGSGPVQLNLRTSWFPVSEK